MVNLITGIICEELIGAQKDDVDNKILMIEEGKIALAEHVQALLEDVDEDKNGTLEWEEFIEFFRRAGYLLEYATKDNPREQIAGILGQIHDSKTEGKTCDTRMVESLSSLGKEHLPTNTRRKSQDLTQDDAVKQTFGRRSSEPMVMAGRLAITGAVPQLSPGQQSVLSPTSTAQESVMSPRRRSVT